MIGRKLAQILLMILLVTSVLLAALPKRKLVGPRPLIEQLWRTAKSAKVPMWGPKEFYEQEFRYLGQTQTAQAYHLVNFVTIWGQSHRATKRLLVFDSRFHFLGMYSHLDPGVQSLKGNLLIHESGQADFSAGPPAKIENSVYESASSVLHGY